MGPNLLMHHAEIRGALKSAREAFNAADAAREAALDAAVAAVTRGSGETQLDACVAEALQRLDDIEAGYRCVAVRFMELAPYRAQGALGEAMAVARAVARDGLQVRERFAGHYKQNDRWGLQVDGGSVCGWPGNKWSF